MVFGKQSLQGYEPHRWKADGVRVENIPRIRNVGPYRRDSKINGRPTESSSFQCTTTLQGKKKETQKDVKKSLAVANYARGVILGTWVRKELVRNPHRQTWRTLGQKLLNKWWWIFADTSHPIFRASCALERGESRSKGGCKKSFHVAMKTSSCFSALWFLRISSVSTEQ